ncbi:MAG: Gldg family protein [Oscillospiraceae bacterium]|nr:Gldg family protein [Oscillospiraceae bacterium]
MKLTQNKKFKYGSVSVLFSVAFIALLLAVNLLVTSLSLQNSWFFRLDLSDSDIYEISDITHDVFADLIGEGEHFEIVFMQERDRIEHTADIRLHRVHTLALRYQQIFDFVTVRYIDPITRPDLVRPFVAHSINATVRATDVVIQATSGQFRIHAIEGFFAGQETSVFVGERRFTTSMIALATSDAIAYFTVGHGEVSYDDPSISNFRELLEIAGFEVRSINLMEEEIDPRARLIIVNNPRMDFHGVRGVVNEIAALQNFLEEQQGNLMVFLDYDPNIVRLPELQGLLEERGIYFRNERVIESAANAMLEGGHGFFATYVQPEQSSLGASFHAGMRAMSSPPPAAMRNARTIDFRQASINPNRVMHVAPILTTSRDATSLSGERLRYEPLLVVSREEIYAALGFDTHYVHVIAGGSSSFITNEFVDLDSPAFANNDIMWAALRATVSDNVDERVPSIPPRGFATQELIITDGQANTWMIILSAVVPLAVMIVGAVVFVKRRYR